MELIEWFHLVGADRERHWSESKVFSGSLLVKATTVHRQRTLSTYKRDLPHYASSFGLIVYPQHSSERGKDTPTSYISHLKMAELRTRRGSQYIRLGSVQIVFSCLILLLRTCSVHDVNIDGRSSKCDFRSDGLRITKPCRNLCSKTWEDLQHSYFSQSSF